LDGHLLVKTAHSRDGLNPFAWQWQWRVAD